MKINTDGVLLGALVGYDKPATILDIGTGTGVIAMMMAQHFPDAVIDAVEIDPAAAETAGRNFDNSPFRNKPNIYPVGLEAYFEVYLDRKYDVIVSNPPFYINSLTSPGAKKNLAKHTDIEFFERLIKTVCTHLKTHGCFWIIVPVVLKKMIIDMAQKYTAFPRNILNIRSYTHSDMHRIIVCFSFDKVSTQISTLTIYEATGVYSEEYQKLLQPYFLNF